MWWKAVLIWLLFMVAAIANGTLRQYFINPSIGEAWGHMVSTTVLCAVILFITWTTIRWIAPASGEHAWAIGAAWFVMTLAFEFGMGHFISRISWAEMLAQYDLLKGQVWVFVPLVTLIAPRWMAKLRRMLP